MQDSNGISFYGEIVRKSIHLSNLIIPLSIYLFGPSKVFPYLLVTMFFCITMDLLRINNNYFRNIYNKIFGLITRNKESSIFTGATNVMIGATIVTLLFNEKAVIPALIIMSVSDTLAAIVGIKLGRTYLVNNKTLEGTFAFFYSSFIILYFLGIDFSTSIAISLATALSELFVNIKFIDDNLSIPLIVASLVTILV